MPKPLDWRALLVDGYEPLKTAQRLFRHLPHDPRCKLCQNPFAGVGGKLVGLIGRKPSRKNPNLCQYCFDHLPSGGIEIDIGVVFVDVRASTTLAELSTATEYAGRLNRFYSTATDALIRHDAIIDKLIGDEVMALFLPGLAGPDYRRKTANAALDVAASVTDLPIGVAANAGMSFVGNVGSGSVCDFTALGDAVNVGARLQALASAGQVVLATDLYRLVEDDHPSASHETISVKGRSEPVDIVVLSFDATGRAH